MLRREDIVRTVADLGLAPGSYWVTAGAGLVMHGIRGGAGDIDMGCTATVIEEMRRRGHAVGRAADGSRRVEAGACELYEDWGAGATTMIDGICVSTLPEIRRVKAALGREKDQLDIAAIDARLFAEMDKKDYT